MDHELFKNGEVKLSVVERVFLFLFLSVLDCGVTVSVISCCDFPESNYGLSLESLS